MNWPRRWASCLALLLCSVAPLEAQETPTDITPDVLLPGDSVTDTVFAFDRGQMEALATRLRQDSIRIANLRQDTANLVAQRDSIRSALVACGQVTSAQDTVLKYERAARKALKAAQPSGLEGLLINGPSGFVFGGAVGLTAGVFACQGAN